MRFSTRFSYKRIFVLSILVALLIPIQFLYSQEQTSSDIQIYVRLSICGDEIIEGSEDCEPTIFEEFSCSLLGYEGGNVYCDNSCKFDFLECIIPEPPEPPVIDDDIPIDFDESVEKYLPKTRLTEAGPIYDYPLLIYFDFNGNGKIDGDEFVRSVRLWAEYWKRFREQDSNITILKCDFNRDGQCDIVDLSILLYHTK